METHEHDGCSVPKFKGYNKISMWSARTSTSKGHARNIVLIREMWSGIVKVETTDPNDQFIWLNITKNKVTFRLATCYFAPKNSSSARRQL